MAPPRFGAHHRYRWPPVLGGTSSAPPRRRRQLATIVAFLVLALAHIASAGATTLDSNDASIMESAAAAAHTTGAAAAAQAPTIELDLTAAAESIVSSVVGHIVSFILVTVPATALALVTRALSWSLVLTFDYRGVVLMLILGSALTYAIVHRVYLTKYSRLPQPAPPLKAQGASYDLHPDATGVADDHHQGPGTRGPSGFNYAEDFLGSFLQSIRVFGFMEPPVFHELARRLQTRKLPAGDMLFTADAPGENNFYIVVDGCVQVYVRNSGTDHSSHHPLDSCIFSSSMGASATSAASYPPHLAPPSGGIGTPLSSSMYAPPLDPDEPLPGHTLLNEVHAGGTVSSLFSILSLFSHTLGNDVPPDVVAAPPPADDVSPWSSSSSVSAASGGHHQQEPSMYRSRSTTVENSPLTHEATSRPHPLAHTYYPPPTPHAHTVDESVMTDPTFSDLAHTGSGDMMIPDNNSSPSSASGSSGDSGHVFPHIDNAAGSPRPSRGSRPSTANRPTLGSRQPTADMSVPIHPTLGAPAPHLSSSSSSLPNSSFHSHARSSHSRQPTATHPSSDPTLPSILDTGMTARASRDTTLLVLPAEAFLRLLDKYPHAAAHIAQVILTRFQRVTCAALAQYLGMPAAVLAIDQQLHEYATVAGGGGGGAGAGGFRPGGLERLRRRFHMGHSLYRGHVRSGTGGTEGGEQVGGSGGGGGKEPGLPTPAAGGGALGLGISGGSGSRRASVADLPIASEQTASSTSAPNTGPPGTPAPSLSGITGPSFAASAASTAAAAARAAAVAAATTPLVRKTRALTGIPTGVTRMSVMSRLGVSDGGGRETPLASSGLTGQGTEYGHANASSMGGAGGVNMGGDTRAFDDPDEEMHLRRSVFASILHAIGLRDAAAAVLCPDVDECGSASIAAHVPHAVPPPTATAPALRSRATAGWPLMSTASSSYAASPAGSHPSISSSASATSAVSEVDTNDVEIRFYRKGTPLVKPGQPVDGLFYVIDGLLAISTPPANAAAGGAGASARGGAPGPMLVAAQQQQHQHQHQQHQHQPHLHRQEPVAAVSSASTRAPAPAHQYFVRPGGLAGYMPALTGHASFLKLEARTDLCVGFMPKHAIDRLVDRQPAVILTLAYRLVSVLSPLVLHIDFALEWMQVNAGHVLYRQNDASDSIYMVLNGRLRAIQEQANGTFDIVSEHGQGESVGEQDVLMGTPRPHTTHAIRDTELAQMPHTLFEALALRHPEITLAMARIIAGRSQRQAPGGGAAARVPGLPIGGGNRFAGGASAADLGKNNANLRTVAVLPVHSAVPVLEFADKLHAALVHTLGESALLLTQASVLSVLGKHAFTRMGKLKLMSWLAEQETRHRIVLYVADGGVTSPWTQRCIRQADCILLVAVANQDPVVGEYERYMLGVKTTARKELVLLHPTRSCEHGLTRKWLSNRLWIHGHHHVAMPMGLSSTAMLGGEGASGSSWSSSMSSPKPPAPGRSVTRNAKLVPSRTRKGTYGGGPMVEDLTLSGALDHLKGTLRHYYSQYTTPLLIKLRRGRHGAHAGDAHHLGGIIGPRSDFARLARRLCGRSIGLVLGGGGARGISHLGVIRALEEAGVPIDMVGGTSIGSMVGGLYARDVDHVSVLGRLKAFSGRMASVWRTLLDVTYPITSYLTGHQFNRGVWKAFGDIQIEDLWLSYFAITTNIVDSRMEVHQTGYLWRYVRASMSLSGFLPPLSDNGILLVDGGYLNNLPGDIMKGLGADLVIMVDVASDDDTSKVHIDDSLSGFAVMLNRWNPFRQGKAIPTLADIQSKLAYVSCIRQLEEAKQLPGCFYLRPPVANFGTIEFGNFEQIYRVGYEYGKQIVREWEKSGVLQLFVNKNAGQSGCVVTRARRNSI